MSMKNEIAIKGTMNSDNLADILQDLANSIRDKKVCIERGSEFVTLNPSVNIEVEIEARKKKDKEKLSIELSWRQVEKIEEEEEGFSISSSEPEMEAPLPANEPAGTEESTQV